MEDSLEYARALARLLAEMSSSGGASTGGTPPGGTSARNTPTGVVDRLAKEVEERARNRSMRLELEDGVMFLRGEEVQMDLMDLEPLVRALLSHKVRRFSIRQFTSAREIRDVAWLLTRPADEAGSGTSIDERVAGLRLWNVEIVGEGSSEEVEEQAVLPSELLDELREDAEYAQAESAMAKLATYGEEAIAKGDAPGIGAALVAMTVFERRTKHDDLRRGAEVALKRLFSPMAVRLTAQLLPRARRREPYLQVLARAGDLGVEALFAHLIASNEMHDRRAYFDAIVELRAGIPMLLETLRHPQWYVARNAAELLGDMRIEKAQPALSTMLQAKDDRLRAAAASALARIRTPQAMSSLQTALRDVSSKVRFFANTALLANSDATASQLASVLEREEDIDVQVQIVEALGRLGTPDAVQKLIRALSPMSMGRRPSEPTTQLRCAAIEAVAQARGGAALSVIRPLMTDRDVIVRETARRVAEQLR